MKKHVLIVINGMNVGGAETFIMKMYRKLDKSKFQFDFLINAEERCFYEDEIEKFGGTVLRGVSKSKNVLKCFFTTYNIIRGNKYKNVLFVAVHPLVVIDLFAAVLAGAKNRMVRSTNSSAKGGVLGKIVSAFCRPFVRLLTTKMLAPSDIAAGWLFGKNAAKSKKFSLITNGINTDDFIFTQEKRNKVRREFNIEGKFVVGHIGRFNVQKNHTYLLEIFKEIIYRKKDSALLLVGIGELEDDIRKKAKDLGILDNIIFAGLRNDVNEILMGMDVLVFPSLYEGMPNVVIESQATGLPCIVSDTITKQAKLTDLVFYKSIQEPPSNWAEAACQIDSKRQDRILEIIKQGYSIENTTEFIQGLII